MSVRQIALYDAADLSSVLHKIDLNTSPSILIPFYDEDSSVLFATGRVSSFFTLFRMCTLSRLVPVCDMCSLKIFVAVFSCFTRLFLLDTVRCHPALCYQSVIQSNLAFV